MDTPYGTGLRILIVDDESLLRDMLEQMLGHAGFLVTTSGSLEDATALAMTQPFDLVLIDKNLPDGNGLELLRKLAERTDDCEFMVMSAYANIESAVQAIRLRVADYLMKPFQSLAEVHGRISRVVTNLMLKRENKRLIEELRDKNKKLEELVVRDALTGLYNHAFLHDRLEGELARSQRYGRPIGLLFIDIDYFKEINDSVGHPYGDLILKSLADILLGKPQSDAIYRAREQDVAVRYGGDEFVLLLPETDKAGALAAAERLRTQLSRTKLGARAHNITLSIGVAGYPEDGVQREALIAAADAALYAAKRQGRNRAVCYSPSLLQAEPDPKEQSRRRALTRSVSEQAFRYVYQPICHAATGEVYGYEALCRPMDPELGGISDAVRTAEGTGAVMQLGRVMRTLAVEPLNKLAGAQMLFVNLHPHELTDPTLWKLVPEASDWHGRVVLEISETTAMDDYERTAKTLASLRERGFKIALDDVGRSGAGLSALAKMEADFVKLDRTLLQGLATDARKRKLISHIIAYAQSEHTIVIAEGIESADEWQAVYAVGCALVQGFYVGKPAPTFTTPHFDSLPIPRMPDTVELTRLPQRV